MLAALAANFSQNRLRDLRTAVPYARAIVNVVAAKQCRITRLI
jgi:hypothetical protein